MGAGPGIANSLCDPGNITLTCLIVGDELQALCHLNITDPPLALVGVGVNVGWCLELCPVETVDIIRPIDTDRGERTPRRARPAVHDIPTGSRDSATGLGVGQGSKIELAIRS